jgi:hypothetical protein
MRYGGKGIAFANSFPAGTKPVVNRTQISEIAAESEFEKGRTASEEHAPLLEDCAARLSSMEPCLGHSRGVASLIRGLPNKSLQLSRKGARMRPFPLEELCCSDQQHGTLLGYLPEFVSYESPSTQWATQLVLSGPVKAVGSS